MSSERPTMKERIAAMDGYLNGYDAVTEADQRHAYDVGFADAVRAASLAPVAEAPDLIPPPITLDTLKTYAHAHGVRLVDAADAINQAAQARVATRPVGDGYDQDMMVAPPSPLKFDGCHACADGECLTHLGTPSHLGDSEGVAPPSGAQETGAEFFARELLTAGAVRRFIPTKGYATYVLAWQTDDGLKLVTPGGRVRLRAALDPEPAASPLPRATEPEASTKCPTCESVDPSRCNAVRGDICRDMWHSIEARASSEPPVGSQSQDAVMFDLRAALVELQSAAWSRSWKRVKAARAAVEAITGFSVPGPLVHSQEAPASGPSDERSEP